MSKRNVSAPTQLRQRMIEDMTVRNLSPATQASYITAVKTRRRRTRLLCEPTPAEDLVGIDVVLARYDQDLCPRADTSPPRSRASGPSASACSDVASHRLCPHPTLWALLRHALIHLDPGTLDHGTRRSKAALTGGRRDSHYSRAEAMEWAENNDIGFIMGLAGNAALERHVKEGAMYLRFRHAAGTEDKRRTWMSFEYKAKSWPKPRRVVARLEASLQPDDGGMRQEVDVRYIVTTMEGSAEHLYEDVYCQRGQMENLIKLHKAQLASDRTSAHSPVANQVRLVLHTAAYWIMHTLRAAVPKPNTLAKAEFGTIRQRLIKIAARIIEHAARIRVFLPTSCPDAAMFTDIAEALMPAEP